MTRNSALAGFTPARTLVVTSAVGIIVALLLLVVQAASRPAHAATNRLPDLGMAKFKDLRIQRANEGRRLLRFSSILVNVGAGRFEARGRRPGTGTHTMRVRQRIYNGAGGYRTLRTGAVMYFAGGRHGDDGHFHWHMRNLEKFKLTRLDNGRKVGTIAKHGFCFFDNYRYGSTRPPLLHSGPRGLRRLVLGPSSAYGPLAGLGRHIQVEPARLVHQHHGSLPREVQAQGCCGSVRLVQRERQLQQLHLGRPPDREEWREGTGPRSERLDRFDYSQKLNARGAVGRPHCEPQWWWKNVRVVCRTAKFPHLAYKGQVRPCEPEGTRDYVR